MSKELKLFTGTGNYLEIPTEWTDYPEKDCPVCARNIRNGVGRYTGSNNPFVLATAHGYYESVKIPFGHWYMLDGKNSKIVRPWTYDEMKAWMKEKK